MPSRRNNIALTDEERTQYLADGWNLQVASIGPGGFPHLVAMWYVLDDEGRVAASILGPLPSTRTLVDLVDDTAHEGAGASTGASADDSAGESDG